MPGTYLVRCLGPSVKCPTTSNLQLQCTESLSSTLSWFFATSSSSGWLFLPLLFVPKVTNVIKKKDNKCKLWNASKTNKHERQVIIVIQIRHGNFVRHCYNFIFRLKNPAGFNHEFWSVLINLWSFLFGWISQIGKVWICSFQKAW